MPVRRIYLEEISRERAAGRSNCRWRPDVQTSRSCPGLRSRLTSAAMKLGKVLGLGAVLVGLTLAPMRAAAEQRHDWMLAASDPGNYVNLDIVFGAVQAAYEDRTK